MTELLDDLASYRCRANHGACGSTNVEIELRDGTRRTDPYDGDGEPAVLLRCRDCGSPSWWPKQENETKRRDANERWRKQWQKTLGGELICGWCYVRESETRSSFEIAHKYPLEKEGPLGEKWPDEFWNTMVLCHENHCQQEQARQAVAHVHFRSAREPRGRAA